MLYFLEMQMQNIFRFFRIWIKIPDLFFLFYFIACTGENDFWIFLSGSINSMYNSNGCIMRAAIIVLSIMRMHLFTPRGSSLATFIFFPPSLSLGRTSHLILWTNRTKGMDCFDCYYSHFEIINVTYVKTTFFFLLLIQQCFFLFFFFLSPAVDLLLLILGLLSHRFRWKHTHISNSWLFLF